jgi:hypothetical protein
VVSASTPAVATLLWPLAGANGAIRPTYRWNQVTAATWYQLWVDEMGAPPLIQTWYFSGDVCSGSVCSLTPDVPLRPGASYRWFVRAWSSRGQSPWSPGTTFSIATAAPPAATLVSPAGNGVAALPTYTWNRVPGASWYYLWVTQAGSGPVVQRWYRAEEICGCRRVRLRRRPVSPRPTASSGGFRRTTTSAMGRGARLEASRARWPMHFRNSIQANGLYVGRGLQTAPCGGA